MKHCEFSDEIGTGTYVYVLMVRVTEGPTLLNPTGKKIELPQFRTAASLDMRKLLPGRLQE